LALSPWCKLPFFLLADCYLSIQPIWSGKMYSFHDHVRKYSVTN
jgi:hypothetical protein